jgi:vitamin B12 transporter
VGTFFGPLSTRGAGSLSNNQMKVYIDGIEAANASVASIDPASIERIEVIRGPQAATLYGSDAISGVLQVFTKRGDSTIAGPQINAATTLGAIQSPYQGSGALAQQYSGSVRGSNRVASYAVGGSYSSFGNWMPIGSYNLPSAYAGLRMVQGPLSVDLSARYSGYRGGAEPNPALAGTGFFYYAKPFYYYADHTSRTVAARATVRATPKWLHSITIGDDENGYNLDQTQPRLLNPGDTLLFTLDSRDDKLTFGYNTTFTTAVSSNLTATLIGGLDHYRLYQFSYFTTGARTAEGSITPSPAQPLSGSRNTTTNTGYFAQLQLAYRSSVYMTAGLRAEENSNFGSDLSTPLSPRLGLSYVGDLGAVTIKLRGSYGQAIRPPTPGQTQASAGANESRIANPLLGPERQDGWDAGIDVSLAGRGGFGATYYDQVATDGIQYVVVDLNRVPPVTQYQNVGRVRNRGLELEGTLRLGSFASLTGQFAITDSRIDATGPNYTGDLRVGDRPMLIPKYTAGATLAVFPLPGTAITGGFTYVGDWTGYDWYARNACFGGTAPCRASTRDYIITYPSVAKINLGVTQRLTPWLSGVAVAHNLGNNLRFEETNAKAVMGRVTMVGFEVRY